MSDELKKQIDTLTANGLQMQNALHVLQTEKQILNQTLGEVMTGNVQVRTALALMENQCKALSEQAVEKDAVIKDLTDKLAVANTIVSKTTNLVPPANDGTPPPAIDIPAIIPDNGQ